MRLFLSLVWLCAAGLRAENAQDRTAIDRLITALNNPAARARLLEGVDSRVDFDRLIDLHRRSSLPGGVIIGMDEPWTDLTAPRVVSGAIQFITPAVAVVDGASIIRGAVMLAPRVPLPFVMKKEGTEWRISAIRVLAGGHGQRWPGILAECRIR